MEKYVETPIEKLSFSKDPYLKTEGSNYIIILSVKDQKHTIHEKYYVSFLHKFLKPGVRSLTRVS